MDNYYSLLGCDQDASPQQIRKQYKKLALQLHPDKNTSDQAESSSDDFNLINKAVSILTDQKEKHKYDSSLLEKRNCNKIINDEISFDEFIHNQENDCYVYECRCGGQFILEGEYQNKFTSDSNFHIIIDCNSCSLSNRIMK